ncbi:MAG: endonuclease domain-containing protein [Acidobacteria bacterium]|nr:endonuclease domain-containing protein [Acidobacteriota bacterium]
MNHPDGTAPDLARDRARSLRRSSTSAEHQLWMRLRNRQLHGAKFRRQHPIGPYIVDFCCLEARLVIELDGGWHNEELKRTNDEKRTAYLEAQGHTVLRFWNTEVTKDVRAILGRIALHLT